MAKTEKTVGSGITARKFVSYSAEHMEPMMRRWARDWNSALAQSGGSPFGARTLRMAEACRRILAEAGDGPFEKDSLEDFARRILHAHDVAVAAIKRGDVELAADQACDLGTLSATAAMKFRWEDVALKGAALRPNGKRGAEKRHGEKRARWPAMARRYAELRAEGRLEKEAAGIAATEFDVAPVTIRRAAARTS